ncbi:MULTISPECIES: 1,4-dihydroxy-2-naphthoate octaprenyltransferase [unclassified Kaistella]|uniref:1,4-dihydroxy-2-naphthoate octaprenyltransferase n=1 Tax=unclassified Kaistella TaxID=2762626 RepID=UPI0027342C2D|nr:MULTISPECIES: 1,4-dihydroxy-2-naphthoate octaprenyltransferase [unclassified Kaistella]MDP2454028.1 1,4-dihydroxy-2-naphthoate octaprenyltransferase [Kaistella sp. SH11-4b]MDP2457085.1 1,4-dihydroxy-2-naphthoate octaprenyltransferase [Kaistella sp. SH40-3]MDP2459842.1 1,4-dihydroxy-2-naphthoate octaprenyltransferase [Kaistella sp. SH19-2b]
MTDWIKAARLRTLPLSMSGIILGSFIARWRIVEEGGTWDWQIFAMALLVTLLYQILSNFANDYGDGIKGTDKLRVNEAEQRAVASGRITATQMRNAVIIFSILSLVATIALLYMAFFKDNLMNEFYTFVGLGVACILAAIGYTIGKKPYGYLGLGDIMVFIFFGLVSVGGSYFLFTKHFDWDILLPATAVGLLSAAVLNLNNMRDIESDALSGKKTLALRLGFKGAMVYEIILLQLPLIIMLFFMMMNDLHTEGKYYAFIFFILMLPMTALRRKIMQVKEPKELDPFLKQVGIMTLTMAILVAFGLNYF